MSWLDKFLQALNLVQSGGASLPQQPTLNFIGATVTNDAPNNRTVVTVSGNLQVANILDFGGNGNGTTDNAAAMAAAIIALAPNGVVYFPPGLYRFSITQEWDANVWFGHGSAITVDSLATVTIVGAIDANIYQDLFQGAGNVVLQTSSQISACWFGADPTNTTPCAANINAAIIADATAYSTGFGNLRIPVLAPGGHYSLEAPVVVSGAGSTFKGAGKAATLLSARTFVGPAIVVSNGLPMTVHANDYAGGNSVNLGDDRIILLKKYGNAWNLNGRAGFCLDIIANSNGALTGTASILSSSGQGPDHTVDDSAFNIYFLGAEFGFSNTNPAIKFFLTTTSGTVAAQTAAGCWPTDGTWTNVRLDYDGSALRIFVNGVAQTLASGGTSIAQTGTIVQKPWEAVALGTGFMEGFDGGPAINYPPPGCRCASLRFGWVSRGSSNYSVTTAKFTEDGSTAFLINFDVAQTRGALQYARAYASPTFGMQDAWLPVESASNPLIQITNVSVSDMALEAQSGPAIFALQAPAISFDDLIGNAQSGIVCANNCYNAHAARCNFNSTGDGSSIGGLGSGIRLGGECNFFSIDNCLFGGFDVAVSSSGNIITLEGWNYLIGSRYCGLYVESCAVLNVGGDCFMSDEGSSYANSIACALVNCGEVSFTGTLLAFSERTDQRQVWITNLYGSSALDGSCHIKFTACEFGANGAGLNPIRCTNLSVIDSVVLDGCSTDLPYFTLDSTCLGRITVRTEELQNLAVTMTDADYTLDINSWVYGKLVFSGTLTADRNVIVPTLANYTRTVENLTARALLIKTTAGTGVYIPPGLTGSVSCDGTNVVLEWLEGAPVQLITSGTSSTASPWAVIVGVDVGTAYNLTGPTGTKQGQTFVAKDNSGAAGTNHITLTAPAGQTYDGGGTATIATNYGRASLAYDGVSNWMS